MHNPFVIAVRGCSGSPHCLSSMQLVLVACASRWILQLEALVSSSSNAVQSPAQPSKPGSMQHVSAISAAVNRLLAFTEDAPTCSHAGWLEVSRSRSFMFLSLLLFLLTGCLWLYLHYNENDHEHEAS